MTACRSLLVLLAGVALSGVSSLARAQPAPARDPAAAEALFRTAQQALTSGDWTTACAKFDASMALDPAVSTLINLAKCREHEGKLATAWAELQRALVMNRDTPSEPRRKALETYANGLVAALEPRLPRLTIALAQRPPGLRISRDGVEIPLAVLGDALPLDPGTHVIEASAPGYHTDKRTLELAEGKAVTVELAMRTESAAALPAPPAARAPSAPPPAPPAPPRPVSTAPPPAAAARISPLVYVGFGVGGAGFLGAAITGGLSLSKVSSVKSQCSKDGTCPPGSLGAAGTLAKVCDVTLGVGAAGVVAGVVGVVISKRGARPAGGAWVEPYFGSGTMGVQGAF